MSTSNNPVKFRKELATLNYKLGYQKRIKDEKDKEKPPKPIEDNFNGSTELNTFIDSDIQRLLQKSSWKKLDRSFQWRFIKEYISNLHLKETNVIDKIRADFNTKKLDKVQYDKESNTVTLLGWSTSGGQLI